MTPQVEWGDTLSGPGGQPPPGPLHTCSRSYCPGLARVAVLWNAANPYPAIVFKETQAAGRTLGIEVQSLEVRSPNDFDGAFETARKQRPNALITVEDPLTFNYQKRIADFAVANQLPSLHGLREFVIAGGLMSYGANIADLVGRAAGYVDKLLKGAKPADLPVQQSTKAELVINLKTANALGLTFPITLLGRADEVIENVASSSRLSAARRQGGRSRQVMRSSQRCR
jgi:ABC-type uncharacterized transport system substrate-binding protein